MAQLTIGSLFSGIGGLEAGLEMAGVGATAWQVEKDPFCRQVLAKHWPDVVRHRDVRGVGINDLRPVDVICGGFPCKDISCAGKGAGVATQRTMWSEFDRVICELRPRYVVLENVSALLANGMGTILGCLAASGYDAWWDCIPASAVGASHQRDRVFVVAFLARGRADAGGSSRRNWHAEATSGVGPRGRDIARTVPDAPGAAQRLAALGNAVVPQCAQVVGHALLELDRSLS